MDKYRLTDILIQLGQLVTIIWGLTEVIGRIFRGLDKVAKEGLALVIGMGLTLAMVLLGYVDINPTTDVFPMWKKVVSALVLGLCIVGASYLLNDKAINPMKNLGSQVLAWFRERGQP